MLYIYKKYKDVYTIKNDEPLLNINYTIYNNNYNSKTVFLTGTIKSSETFILPITFIDGVYSITLKKELEIITLPDIYQYNNTLLSIINNVQDIICNCENCQQCKDCNKTDDCNNYLFTLNKIIGYFNLLYPKYNSYNNIISNSLKYSYNEKILCILNKELYEESKQITKLNDYTLGIYYSLFYLFDVNQSTDLEESQYIKQKYKINIIEECLLQIGININSLSDLFLENEIINTNIYYWQFNNIIDNIIDISDITIEEINTKPNKNLSEFEQGVIINYSNIGRIIFAIKETSSLNFQLLDNLNNDITDEFKTLYLPTIKTVLFVSNSVVSYSNIYFKFKKINYL